MCSEETHQPGTYDFVLYEVTHDFVIEVLDGCPSYALLNILFLKDRKWGLTL